MRPNEFSQLAVVLKRTSTPDTVPEWFTEGDFAAHAGSDLQGCWESDFPEAHVVYWTCELDGEGQAGLSEILDIGVLVRAQDVDRARGLIEQHEQKREST